MRPPSRAAGLLIRHVFSPVSPAVVHVRFRSGFKARRSNLDEYPDVPWQTTRIVDNSPPAPLWPAAPRPIPVTELPAYLASRVSNWSDSHTVQTRLIRFGVPPQDVRKALMRFASAMRSENVFEQLGYDAEQLERMSVDVADRNNFHPLDVTLTRLFYEWASHPKSEHSLQSVLPDSTFRTIRTLFRTVDLTNQAARHVHTRTTRPCRKIIMHVGPTNSGKTHNALRALAAAKKGCYAGPLRLLAHEIYMRLNQGQIVPLQIVPLGVDPSPAEPDPATNLEGVDTEGRAVVRKEGDERYARQCNLLTGEEQIILDPEAPLLSCTVEMVPLLQFRDVLVIDEIQMLADPERGTAWTSAVLGANAAELHLCGEEASVPLVQAILRDTGDEIIVNRYERLSPLKVGDSALESLKDIRKGDCVVAFSRSTIFAFRKIKRIIFSQVRKSDGQRDHLLTPPQIKQIAGRAGRFGLHGDDTGGIVTTLLRGDLHILVAAMAYPVSPIRYARIRPDAELEMKIEGLLPPKSSYLTYSEVLHYVSKVDPCYEVQSLATEEAAARAVASVTGRGSVSEEELILLRQAPVPWRNPLATKCGAEFIRFFQSHVFVDVRQALNAGGLLPKLLKAMELSKIQDPSTISEQDMKEVFLSLYDLETVHRMLCSYSWLNYRLPVGFGDGRVARQLKRDTEFVISWCLRELSRRGYTGRTQKRPEGFGSSFPRKPTGNDFGFGKTTRRRSGPFNPFLHDERKKSKR
ncbi:RNA helicase [Steccherinum ochraceum]|uniref:RNA helicase n=1 Tax=Steccherinum ochraceum TaxID=92696 RepID=A0A4R0RGJ2_9APHY|nr:RNA helicase [Steccherinum ochraceum]